MRRLPIVLLLTVFFLTGCASTSATRDDIPEGAKEIRIYSDRAPDAMFETVRQALVSRDYEVETGSDWTLETDYRDIGQATRLKVTADVDVAGNGSVTTLHANWAAYGDSDVVEQAAWHPGDASSFAFGALTDMAKALPGRLEYVSQ